MRYVSSIEQIGFERGIAEGEARGEARGKIQGEARLLQRLIERRFKEELPERYRHKLATASEDDLLRWGEAMQQAESMDKVFM